MRYYICVSKELVKTDKIPRTEIKRAIEYRNRFIQDPSLHGYEMKD